jgi:hypothetical protein
LTNKLKKFDKDFKNKSGIKTRTMESPTPVNFLNGSWSLYYHDTQDQSWTEESYKKVATFNNYKTLWAALGTIGADKFNNGMWFFMLDPHPPLWENSMNIRGGSYCIKVGQNQSFEIFQRYIAAATLNLVSKRPVENKIVGVSISPKKGFHIIKIWNSNGSQDSLQDLALLDESLKVQDILYRPNVNQRM